MTVSLPPFPVAAPEDGHTLAKVLRSRLHAEQPSWAQVKAMIEARRVTVGGGVCVDPARRLKEGDTIELLARPHRLPEQVNAPLVIRHLDDHVVVVEKPSGVSSVRHPAELEWSERKRQLDPTLQDLTMGAIARQLKRPAKSLPPLRIVHRLDKETSGLLAFARSPLGERELGLQFRKHSVVRRYLAVVPGYLKPQTIRSVLVRDRGDGRRGSTKLNDAHGKTAVTHVEVIERFRTHTLMGCRLETGRTHQIRIHLSEEGHPVCGEKVYTRTADGRPLPDASGPPRLALHAAELGFRHPASGAELHWQMPLPVDLQRFVDGLK